MAALGSRPWSSNLSARSRVERELPGLVGTHYEVTSPVDPSYNCVAWAAGDSRAWWEPVRAIVGNGLQGGYYWPPDAPIEMTVDSFVRAFRQEGYQSCGDGGLEENLTKIAIFATALGVPTHVARQLSDGRWASKLGRFEDIEHDAATDVEGDGYGTIVQYMCRDSSIHRASSRVM